MPIIVKNYSNFAVKLNATISGESFTILRHNTKNTCKFLMKNIFIPSIDTHTFRYTLPEDRIAKYPLDEREGSKLLIANPRIPTINHSNFYRLPEYLPEKSILIRNDTKVITARLIFRKDTGGSVELLLLNPLDTAPQDEMLRRETSMWFCLIGGRNIKEGMRLICTNEHCEAVAIVLKKNGNEGLVQFSWKPTGTVFAHFLDLCGTTPLPPYLHRSATEDDKERYQTVYAIQEGSVAAPTAGLHFTERVFDGLRERFCAMADVTLHVGLGTFKPITSENLNNFTMHNERFEITTRTISKLRQSLQEKRTIVGVGTTSMRTIESLFWLGIRLLKNNDGTILLNNINIEQWEPYQYDKKDLAPAIDVFRVLEHYAKELELNSIVGTTEIMIVPGYFSHVFDALITNFHQPEGTLMLLVASFVGDYWREIYQTALEEDYRFLSYGDSSLLFKNY